VASPNLIVTLGNAAIRVLEGIADDAPGLRRLSANELKYGQLLRIRIGARSVPWLALAHPASPSTYQRAHTSWIANVARIAEQRGLVAHELFADDTLAV
jgi:hypothetical protein